MQMTMPSAPLSSVRVATAYSSFGTQAIDVMPASSRRERLPAATTSITARFRGWQSDDFFHAHNGDIAPARVQDVQSNGHQGQHCYSFTVWDQNGKMLSPSAMQLTRKQFSGQQVKVMLLKAIRNLQ